jgi:glutathione S-transferase
MESNYTLYYFPGNLRGALIRAILTYSGAKWEDKRIIGEEFITLQKEGKFEYGSLPVVVIDSTRSLSQSLAIETYLGKQFNLVGDSEEDFYEVMNILCSREDLYSLIVQLAFPTEEQTKRMPDVVKSIKNEELPFYLSVWEKKYKAKCGKYFIGDKFTLVDMCCAIVFEVLTTLKATKSHGFGEVIAKNAPSLLVHVENLKSNELVSYFKNVFNYEGLL